MSTVIVAFYDVNGAPLTGLTPTFTAYKTLAGVNAAAPAVTELGLGLYGFTPSATDNSTGIAFILYGGAACLSPYWSDGIESSAAAAAGTVITPVGVNLFTVTPTSLYSRHFPQWTAPTTEGNPTSATVAEIIDECAATLEAKLLQESITATAITTSNSAAYLWCRETLRLMAAIAVLAVASQQVPEVSKGWQKQLDERWKELQAKGYLALGGGVTAPAADPHGPTTHIQTYGLDTGDPADASSARPIFRKDDHL